MNIVNKLTITTYSSSHNYRVFTILKVYRSVNHDYKLATEYYHKIYDLILIVVSHLFFFDFCDKVLQHSNAWCVCVDIHSIYSMKPEISDTVGRVQAIGIGFLCTEFIGFDQCAGTDLMRVIG